MAATTSSSLSRRWAALDDALEDSDQSFVSTGALAFGGGRAGLSARRRRPPLASAFFVETTDEEEAAATAAGGGDNGDWRSSSAPFAQRAAPTGTFSSSYSGRADGQRALGAAAQLQPSSQALPLPPRLHIGEIRFPVTRSVLWDRRVLAEPIGVSVEQVLPRVAVAPAAMKQVFQLFRDRLAARRARSANSDEDDVDDDVLCFLCGDAAPIAHAKRVALTRVERKQQRRDKWDPKTLWVPVHAVLGKRCALQQSQAYADDKTDALAAKLQPTLLVTSSTVHSAQLDFQLECPAPPLLFRFALIRNLPLLMTPLAASLSRQEFGSGESVRRSGYLTLDRARKAVPVLKTDPLIVQQPIVGVWVYGVPLSDEWSDGDMSAQFADPFLYFACLGYLASRAIKEKVEVGKRTFLVALYLPGSAARDNQPQVSPLPRFFECSYSEHVDARDRIPVELYAQQKSCLVGVSSFSENVEFTLSPSPCDAWESAREQLGIPTAPRVRREEAHAPRADQEPEQLASSSSVASARPALASRSLSRVTFSRSREAADDSCRFDEPPLKLSSASTRSSQETEMKENEHPNTRPEVTEHNRVKLHEITTDDNHHSVTDQPPSTPSPKESSTHHTHREHSESTPLGARSCCKTQALLTIQHQQILENQQRQLHEMQEQIAHLRRLLDATKTMTPDSPREVFASSRVPETESLLPPLEDPSEHDFAEVTRAEEEEERLSFSVSTTQFVGDFDGDAAEDDRGEQSDSGEDADDKANEAEDVASDNESSLHLSSISSNASMRSDISSLSSSLVGKRMKERFRQSRSGSRSLGESAVGNATLASDDASMNAHGAAAASGSQTVQAVSKDASMSERTDLDQRGREFATQQRVRPRNEAKPEDSEDDDDRVRRAPLEKLLTPDTYLRQRGAFVDRHGGCFTAPTLDTHSFCVPRIKLPAVSSAANGYLSDSDDEEFRLIEQKYKRLLRS